MRFNLNRLVKLFYIGSLYNKMSAENSYRVSPLNYLGVENSDFRSKLYEIAISQPSNYFKLINLVKQRVKNDAIKSLYTSLFNVLSDGKDVTGQIQLLQVGSESLKPSLPQQQINTFCLSAVKTLEEIVDEAIDLILPIDINRIMSSKLSQIGAAENPQA
jgi:hypothetical protein